MSTLSKFQRRMWGLVLVATPPLMVFGIGRIGAAHSSGTLMVILEPALLALAVYGTAAFALHRRWRASLSTALTIGTGAIALHAPLHIAEVPAVVPDWLRPLRGCGILPKAAKAPVRLVSWTVDDTEPMGRALAEITALGPDLVVLIGTDDKEIGAQLSESMGGEVKFFPHGKGITAAVRGSFQYCGGEEDHWVVDLPSAVQGEAQALLTFPRIEHVGVVPLLIAKADRPQSALDLPAWSKRLKTTADLVASAAHTLGPRRMLLVGDFKSPTTAQSLSRPLQQSGLRPVSTPPNWPTRVGAVPFLTIHAMDQLWAGKSWQAQRARVIPAGEQVRAPFVVDLAPTEAHAR